jgi:phosphatidate phosphatase APP1
MLFPIRLSRLAALLVVSLFGNMFLDQASSQPPATNLKSDEEIVFYPTYAQWDAESNAWQFRVHGKVYEPEMGSIKRRLFLAWLRSAINGRLEGEQLRDEIVRPFLVDNERGKTVAVSMLGERMVAGTSEANGHFAAELSLSADRVTQPDAVQNVIPFQAVLPNGDSRSFEGRIHLIGPKGFSVISDIDDTIKDSRVTDKSELLRNTFTREFKPVSGMANLYRQLHAQGTAFHYVSGSPWQLYGPLQQFLSGSGFPNGTMHLKHFRLKDSSALELLGSQRETKLAAIEPLLTAFPQRRFLLMGDSGEQDPEIYGELARRFPNQIAAIYIRNVTDAKRADERFSEAFRDVADDHWFLFDQVPNIDLGQFAG